MVLHQITLLVALALLVTAASAANAQEASGDWRRATSQTRKGDGSISPTLAHLQVEDHEVSVDELLRRADR